MKREPRLQFSDADLAEPKLEKPIKRVKKAEAKADKAQAKIPKKTVVKKERGFDPATGMICTPFTGHPVGGVLLCGTRMSTKGNV